MDEHAHTHDQLVVKITITLDPNHGHLQYHFENCDYARLIGYLELTKQFAFRDMLVAQQPPATEEP